MTKPTVKDAEILLKLYSTFDTPQIEKSMTWFMKEFSAKDYKEFDSKYPRGSDGNMHVGRILATLEIAGVLISNGVLNEDLYFDSSGIEFMWEKLGKIIAGWQKVAGPALWENAVWLAERQKQWKKDVWKPGLAWKMKPQKSGASRRGS
jgi:hypothetical protein